MACLVRLLVGARRGLAILLLCCGLREEQLRDLCQFCRDTGSILILCTDPQLRHLSAIDPTPLEFVALSCALTRVLAQLPAVAVVERGKPELPRRTCWRWSPS